MDYQALHLLLRYGREYGHRRIREKGLTDTGHLISSYVYVHEACSQEELVQALRMDKTTVGKAIASLADKDLLIRRQDEKDKRKNRLFLTDKGKENIGDILQINDEWVTKIFSALTSEEQEVFDGYLQRLILAAKAAAVPAEE